MSSASRVALIVLFLAGVGAALVWWRRQSYLPTASSRGPAVAQPVAPAADPKTPPPPAVPTIRHPVAPAASPRGEPLPTLDDSDAYLKNLLDELLGRKAVLSFLVLDGIARRFVATVSNLATDNAAAGMWPVTKTAGHLLTEAAGGGTVISSQNDARYTGFVSLVGAIDNPKAVALYRAVYPLLQHAYEELGFPGSYLNDRVVEVIDHLLATPDVPAPIQVKLVIQPGAPKPSGPGGLYVFADPTLEASSSGQKIFLRIGRDNAAKLKAKLADIRARIASKPPAPTRQPSAQ